jgi:5-methyltetrahydrofolate--homocysteine methyltransferase
MPERQWLNAVFLAMGMANGLSAVIANPSAPLLMEAKASADALLNRAAGTENYIARFAEIAREKKAKQQTATPAASAPKQAAPAATPGEQAARAILKGTTKQAAALARKAVESGIPAAALVQDHLVPAIMTAGDLFEKGEYYLPQLMLAGEAMRLSLAELEPDLAKDRGAAAAESKGRIVFATVEGDVHDIGKNLVVLMLRNHGFDVVDLGKDVPPAAVIDAVETHKPDIVGLSALMTTTLAAMQKTIKTVRESGAGAKVKFMVGGAAVTEHFANEAGADGYSPDAVSAVKLAGELIGTTK